MPNPVLHFEIGCRDLARTSEFYTRLFDWKLLPGGPATPIDSGSEGISGHFTSLGHEPHNYVTIYVQVDDIQASLEKIPELGGKVMVGPVTLPDGRRFAWFTDPDGSIVGLIQPA